MHEPSGMRSIVARILAPATVAVALGAVAAGCAGEYYVEPAYSPPPPRVYVTPPRAYVAPPRQPAPYCRRAWVPSGYDAYGRYRPGYWRCL
jgi:hypothetical protein